jgi:hypothetical protein
MPVTSHPSHGSSSLAVLCTSVLSAGVHRPIRRLHCGAGIGYVSGWRGGGTAGTPIKSCHPGAESKGVIEKTRNAPLPSGGLPAFGKVPQVGEEVCGTPLAVVTPGGSRQNTSLNKTPTRG